MSPFPSGLLNAPAHGQETVLLSLLFLTVASSALVQIDILYSIFSVLSLALFLLLGLRLDRGNLPFIALLIVYNIGGLIALQPYLHEEESRLFMVGTAFVGITGVFYMMALNENALARIEAIRWGVITGGVIASLVGIAGYLGLAEFALVYGRVAGTFRDPNVYGSFAATAGVMLAADLLSTRRFRLIKLGMFGIIAIGTFLSFSRGSWANLGLGIMVLFALTLITSRDAPTRARILIVALVGLALMAMAMMVLLSNEKIAEVFADRFVLQKDYDSGPSGRFGTQLRAIPELLALPFGHGPNRFSFFYPENPHNTYLMGFSSYGWLGGITFLCFIGALVMVSLRAALTRSPFQSQSIMMVSILFPHLVQNFQIDTDRWRHLFMIYGLSWGMGVITQRYGGEYRRYAHDAYRAAAARVGAAPPASSPA